MTEAREPTSYYGNPDIDEPENVYVNEHATAPYPLPLRLDLRNHSPTGFSWGYNGSGPAQLALALLTHATGDPNTALEYYQQFKDRVIARLPQNKVFRLGKQQVLEHLEAIQNKART